MRPIDYQTEEFSNQSRRALQVHMAEHHGILNVVLRRIVRSLASPIFLLPERRLSRCPVFHATRNQFIAIPDLFGIRHLCLIIGLHHGPSRTCHTGLIPLF